MAFNAKNLSYGTLIPIPSCTLLHPSNKTSNATDKNEPSFLRKLRGQYAGGNAVTQTRPSPFPKKAKHDYDDDGPTYVDEESGEAMSKEEYEALAGFEADKEAKEEEKREIAGEGRGQRDEAVGERDDGAGRVGGNDDDGDEDRGKEEGPKGEEKVAGIGASKKRKAGRVIGGGGEEAVSPKEDAGDGGAKGDDVQGKGKSKAKKSKKSKITVSYGEDEEG